MTNQNQFSSGLESGNFLVTSDPVHQAWSAIEQQRQIDPNAEHSLYNEIQLENQTIIAFGNPPGSLQGQEGLVSSKDFAHFKFLCNKNTTDFCINEEAIRLFQSHYDELLLLKNKLVENSKSRSAPLTFITGQSVGGVVATLFTLWLLEGLDLSKTNRPLCVTFGSPLVGDEHLRKCVLAFSTWKYCFLHIISDQDHAAKIVMSRNTTSGYKPFGTFLLCTASGCACFEDPDLILEQFLTTNSEGAQTPDPNLRFLYGQTLEDLKRKTLCNVFASVGGESNPLKASIVTQLLAIGLVSQDVKNLVEAMKNREAKLFSRRKKNSDSDHKLNEMKISMAFLEWYKKYSKQQKIGYYDRYRNQVMNEIDIDAIGHKKKLMIYWEDSVTEVENKPQVEGAHFKVRLLWAGTNYRRMVEPLHIAEYYKDGGRNYKTGGKRPPHFILLEEWLRKKQEQEQEQPRKSKENVGSSLNDDSCFWARVEEAILLENEGLTTDDKRRLKEFEDYVWNALKTYAVSPEIFLEKSSFMTWWNGYKGVVESSSLFLAFMTNGGPSEYEAGIFT